MPAKAKFPNFFGSGLRRTARQSSKLSPKQKEEKRNKERLEFGNKKPVEIARHAQAVARDVKGLNKLIALQSAQSVRGGGFKSLRIMVPFQGGVQQVDINPATIPRYQAALALQNKAVVKMYTNSRRRDRTTGRLLPVVLGDEKNMPQNGLRDYLAGQEVVGFLGGLGNYGLPQDEVARVVGSHNALMRYGVYARQLIIKLMSYIATGLRLRDQRDGRTINLSAALREMMGKTSIFMYGRLIEDANKKKKLTRVTNTAGLTNAAALSRGAQLNPPKGRDGKTPEIPDFTKVLPQFAITQLIALNSLPRSGTGLVFNDDNGNPYSGPTTEGQMGLLLKNYPNIQKDIAGAFEVLQTAFGKVKAAQDAAKEAAKARK